MGDRAGMKEWEMARKMWHEGNRVTRGHGMGNQLQFVPLFPFEDSAFLPVPSIIHKGVTQ